MKRILALIITFALVIPAAAQPLPSVLDAPTAGISPWWGIIALAVLLIGGFTFMQRRSPSTATSIEDAIRKAMGEFTDAMHRIGQSIESHAAGTAPPAAATGEPPAPPPALGKNGVAGTFATTVTGDPAVDMPAITAAYYRAAP